MSLQIGNVVDLLTFTRASTGTYFDKDGLLKVAANNVMRIDHDPVTLAARGVRLEGAKTNLLLRSQEFDHAVWVKTQQQPPSANAFVAPDGTIAADKLIEAVGAADHYVHQSVTVAANTKHTASLFAAPAERSKGRLYWVTSGFTNGAYADFDLAAGTISAPVAVGTGTGHGASIEQLRNGYSRIALSATLDAASTAGFLLIMFRDNAGNRPYAGDGSSGFYTWGAQVETGELSSYIPTTTATAPRASDLATLPTSAIPFNPAKGTVVAKFRPLGPVSGFPAIVSLNDGTANNSIVMAFYSAAGNVGMGVRVGGTLQADIFRSGLAAPVTAAMAWDNNDFAICANGSAVSTDNAGQVPAGLTRFDFGQTNGGGNAFILLEKVIYLPRRAANAELQALSA